MAVASTIAAGSRGIRAYYVLNKKFKENKSPFVRELSIPNFRKEHKITESLQQLLKVLYEQTFVWKKPDTKPREHDTKYGGKSFVRVIVEDGVKNNWMEKRSEKGWVTRTDLLNIMKDDFKIPKQTTVNRLNLLQERGFIKIQKDFVPKRKPPKNWNYKYAKFVYKIDKKEAMISITQNGISELRYQKKA